MERNDLLEANAQIFSLQGKAINDNADSDVKVLVVGNPANTNALIAYRNAPDLKPRQFTAMTRLDHNRAIAQLAQKTGCHNSDVSNLIIWGNHSATQYPDIHHCTVAGRAAVDLVESSWVIETFIPTVQQRGAAIIKARSLSSAASAANAVIEHMRDWVNGTNGEMVSMGIYSDGCYGVEEGLIFSFPVICKDGSYSVVLGLSINELSQVLIKRTEAELKEEKEGVSALLP